MMAVDPFYLFALHTGPYVGINQNGRYFHTVQAGQTSFVKSNFQTSESNRKDRMSFLPPKLGAIWKFWPSGAILSFLLWLQDSMAPSGQNFHTAPAFGGRNVTIRNFMRKEKWPILRFLRISQMFSCNSSLSNLTVIFYNKILSFPRYLNENTSCCELVCYTLFAINYINNYHW